MHDAGAAKLVYEWLVAGVDRPHWLDAPEIRGFGVGRRVASGRLTDDPCVSIYVDRKRRRRDIECLLPARLWAPPLESLVDVDVLPVGEGCLQRGPTCTGDEVRAADGKSAGTIACLVRRSDDPVGRYLLTNAHVLFDWGSAVVGDRVHGSAAGKNDWVPIGVFSTATGFGGAATTIDAAIARLDNGVELDTLGPVAESWFTQVGQTVYFAGAVSGLRQSRIINNRMSIRATADPHGEYKRDVMLHDQVACFGVTEKGDSGAAVINVKGEIVGIHCWGGTRPDTSGDAVAISVFNKWKNVSVLFDTAYTLDLIPAKRPLDLATAKPVDSTTPLPLIVPDEPAAGIGRSVAVSSGGGTTRDVVARTVYGEARSGEREGMAAVGSVIRNRADSGFAHYGTGLAGVCQKSALNRAGVRVYQFDCWRPGTKNYKTMTSATSADASFQLALEIADEVIAGTILNHPKGARHFYAVGTTEPCWAKGHEPAATIGGHRFFVGIR